MPNNKSVLITGASQRIGAAMAKTFHASGYNIVIHYLQSKESAESLVNSLNKARANSAAAIKADLNNHDQVKTLANEALRCFGGLSLLINNASRFYPDQTENMDSDDQWKDIMAGNLKAPFFLSQLCLPSLKENHGSIINIVDIYGEKPLKNNSIYSISKAGLIMQTQSLALEFAPEVRVNGIAPGAILMPSNASEDPQEQESFNQVLAKTPLAKQGQEDDIVKAAIYLAEHAPYVTGQIIKVDGGRSLNM